MDETFVVDTGGGVLRTQVWHYPSRVECLQCHTAAGGYALGFNTAQLNRDFDYGGAITNQIAALSLAGYFHTNVTALHTLRALAAPTNDAVSLEYRVRSWLAANCVNCHQPGGSAQGALWDARITTPTADAGLINGPLADDPDPAHRVIAPGSLSNSVLLTRIATRGPGQMPPIASTVPDPQAIALISAWITNDLPAWESFADWQLRFFGSTNAPDAAPDADPDHDRAVNLLEYLAGTAPTNSAQAWQISAARSNQTVLILLPQPANRAVQVEVATDLFSPNPWTPLDVAPNAPFFPASNRVAVVPDALDPAASRFYRARIFAP
jgi:mono/diheme cytochrome c family protein